MPRAVTCMVGDNEIAVAEALRLRDQADQRGGSPPDFRFRECGEAVRPHRGGTTLWPSTLFFPRAGSVYSSFFPPTSTSAGTAQRETGANRFSAGDRGGRRRDPT